MSLLERHQKHVWPPFGPLVGGFETLPIKKADGVYLYTEDNRKILDAISSWWVNIHGHSNPEIAEAIYQQAKSLDHIIFSGFTHEPAVELAEKVLQLMPSNHEKVFFSDNGSTAVEISLKIAIQYFKNIGKKKAKIIAIEGAYHGDTFGNMSLAGKSAFYSPFHDYLFEVVQLPFPTEDNESEVIELFQNTAKNGDVCAFVFEPLIQGASGMRVYSASILSKLLAISEENEIVTIADEVMTGFGRTGKNFAFDHLSNKPDIVALSKGLTGGILPLALTSCSSKIVEAFRNNDADKTFWHGHSFTGNPISCACALKSMEIFLRKETQDNIARIQNSHKNIKERFLNHPKIQNVYHIGTILSISIKTGTETGYFNSLREFLYDFFLKRNVLLRPLGNTVYIIPPYIITNEELEIIYKYIFDALDEI